MEAWTSNPGECKIIKNWGGGVRSRDRFRLVNGVQSRDRGLNRVTA